MFAAAAVAAAAALTAISTTQTCDPDQIQKASTNGYLEIGDRSTLSWAQYAAQRRNSMQQRKIEINRRLQKTANNPNNPNASALAKSKNNIQKEIDQLKLTSKQSNKHSSDLDGKLHNDDLTKPPLEFITQLNIDKENIQEEAWFKELSAKVCNEFIKIHEMSTGQKKPDIDANLTSTLTNPTYNNFKEFSKVMNNENNLLEEGHDFFTNTNTSEINHLLLDYIQSHGHELINEKNILGQIVSNIDSDKIKIVRPITAKQQKIIRSYEEKVHYRWDPRWLRIFRKRFCIPVAIITLIFILFTNISPNWISVSDNERAGLWFFCNKTTIKLSTASQQASSPSSSTIASILKTKPKLNMYDNSNEYLTSQLYKKLTAESPPSPLDSESRITPTITTTTKENALIHEKSTKTLNQCFLKFYFKDNHLAILFLALVSLIFHCIGFVLMVYGMFFSTSNRTLYFFHSAGECLVTSALINGLDLLVFWAVVSSQASSDPTRVYSFGYCFYISLFVMLITLGFSSMLYLDDVVNEYSVWKIKQAERNRRKAQMFAGRKSIKR